MKKVLISLFMALFAMVGNAQEYGFPLNEYGDPVVKGTIKTESGAGVNSGQIKAWVSSGGFSSAILAKEEAKKQLIYNLCKNTKSAYNPFAGQFTENLLFTLDITFDENDVNYELTNLQIQEIYAGFGSNVRVTGVAEMIQNVKTAKQAIADAEKTGDKKLIKKAKKENEKLIENNTETLLKAWDELQKLLERLQGRFK